MVKPYRLIRKLLQSDRRHIPYMPEHRNLKDEEEHLSKNLIINESKLQLIYEHCSDIIFRRFMIGGEIEALLMYIEGLSNESDLDEHVLEKLLEASVSQFTDAKALLKRKVPVTNMKEITSFSDIIEQISLGNPVILVNGEGIAYSFGLAKFEKRSIEEPSAESLIRGPREGFTESVGVNCSLLRRKIRSPQLKMESMAIGRHTQTQIKIAYMIGLAEADLIQEVKNRLQRIDIDGILESCYIEEMIEDASFTPFPLILNTERPDVAASSLLEGRVVILVDGTPFVLIAPITFYSLLQSPEDYYQKFIFSTAIRWLRYTLIFLGLTLPSIYISILTFHQEMVPTNLLISIAKSREQIPFPALVEALLMEICFEALREAGIRLPKQIGAAVSIVGALVIGEAATSAGLVSSPMVMVVALTGIASFASPRYVGSLSFRLVRFPIMFLAGTLGLFGLMLGLLGMIIHLSSLRSFGVPYLSPMGPIIFRDIKDTIIRAPLWSLNTRPRLTGAYNQFRQSRGNKPDPSKGDN